MMQSTADEMNGNLHRSCFAPFLESSDSSTRLVPDVFEQLFGGRAYENQEAERKTDTL